MKIIYEDDQVLVCFKESGLPVQSADPMRNDLVSMLKTYLKQSEGDPYLGVIHRLDQPVEGLLIFAKTKAAAAKLSAQIQKGTIRKEYRALVHVTGELSEEELPVRGRLQDFLIKDGRTNTSRVVSGKESGAKEAILDYTITQLLEETTPGFGKNRATVQIRLRTGRHHQIRVQFAHADMPLVGDRKYGIPDGEKQLKLCACAVTFRHPATGTEMRFEVGD